MIVVVVLRKHDIRRIGRKRKDLVEIVRCWTVDVVVMSLLPGTVFTLREAQPAPPYYVPPQGTILMLSIVVEVVNGACDAMV